MAAEATLTESTTEKVWGGGNRPMGASYGKLMMWFFLISDALTFSGFLTAYGLMRFRFEETWPIPENVFTHFPFVHGDNPLLFVALMTFILIMSSVTMVLAVDAGHKMKKNKVVLWLFLTIIGGFMFLGSQAWEWMHFINGDNGSVVITNNHIRKYKVGDELVDFTTSSVMYVSDMEGNLVSLSELVHGPEGHHDHHEKFTAEQVNAAMVANPDVSLKFPGKLEFVMPREDALAHMKTAEVLQGANMHENEYGKKLFANFFFFITGFHGFHVFSGVIFNLIIFINVIQGTYERRGHYEMVEKVGLYWHFVDLVWVFVFTFFYLV